jgi:alginate O-acetyltransferase complex protein AlgI
MDFTSPSFLGFLAVLALLYAVVPRGWRCALIVAGSYVFYWMSSGWLAILLLASTLMAFLAARSRWRPLVILALLMAVLVFYKSLPLLRFGWIMPLGISYYTFKLAGYLIDTHWKAIEPERRLLPFLAFSSFFPQIVGGPIQRAQSFLPQVERAESVSASTAVSGILRILLGFFKKFVIADNLGRIVNYVYGHLTSHPGAPVLFGFYGYPLQMYADFSGLTDIAIGAGVLFGINAPENFNAPFLSASPSEYWRRWHMTLTLWMVDYVFTPLRMALRNMGNSGLVLSLFINMVLIGLWHGFYLTFALFGVVHAIYLSVDALSQKARRRFYKAHPAADRVTDWLGPIVTFHLIAVAFVFFRADGLASVRSMFAHLFDGLGAFSPAFLEVVEQPRRFFPVLIAALVVMECADALRRRFWMKSVLPHFPRWARWSVYSCTALAVLLTVSLLITHSQDSNPFLYAIF